MDVPNVSQGVSAGVSSAAKNGQNHELHFGVHFFALRRGQLQQRGSPHIKESMLAIT